MRQLIYLDDLSVFQLVKRDDFERRHRSVAFGSIKIVKIDDGIAVGRDTLESDASLRRA